MAHDVFISYSSFDKAIADNVCNALERHSMRCWIAPRDILPGETFPAAISRAVKASRVMVLIVSNYTNDSKWVSLEVFRAVELEKVIVPFRVRDTELKDELQLVLGNVHWLDARTQPLESHLGELRTTVAHLLTERTPHPAVDDELAADAHGKAKSELDRLEAEAAKKAGNKLPSDRAPALAVAEPMPPRPEDDVGGIANTAVSSSDHAMSGLPAAHDSNRARRASFLLRPLLWIASRCMAIGGVAGAAVQKSFLAKPLTRIVDHLRLPAFFRFLFANRHPGAMVAFVVGGLALEVFILGEWIAGGGWPGGSLGFVEVLGILAGWLLAGIAGMLLQMGLAYLLRWVFWCRRNDGSRRQTIGQIVAATAVAIYCFVLMFVAFPYQWTQTRIQLCYQVSGEALALLQRGDWDFAVGRYNEMMRLQPRGYKQYFLPELYDYFSRTNYANAIAFGDRAIATNPNNGYGYGVKGLALFAKGDYRTAETYLSSAVSLYPQSDNGGIERIQYALQDIYTEKEAVKRIELAGARVARPHPDAAVSEVEWHAVDKSDPFGGQTALSDLRVLKFLQVLDMSGNTAFFDGNLTELTQPGRISKLRVLNVAGTSVSDAGLWQIGYFGSLQRLTLSKNLELGQGVTGLRYSLPGCQFFFVSLEPSKKLPP